MILNFDPEFQESSSRLPDIQTIAEPALLTSDHFESSIGIVVRLGTQLKADLLSKFKKLRFIATVTTGLDHIDQDYCTVNGVTILSLRGEAAFLSTIRATPEHTWALLLALIRQIPAATSSTQNGQWDRKPFFGHELYGTRLGIIGYGRVGKIVAAYAQAFGMTATAIDTVPWDETKSGVTSTTLDRLLSESDVVSMHLPLNEQTHHFLTAHHFQSMRRSAVFINTARGAVIDESALVQALEKRWISGAAVDVIEDEYEKAVPYSERPIFRYARNHTNLLLTPHIAGSTHDSMRRTSEFIVDKVLRFLETSA